MNREDTGLTTLAGGCFWCLEAVFEQVRGTADAQEGLDAFKEKRAPNWTAS